VLFKKDDSWCDDQGKAELEPNTLLKNPRIFDASAAVYFSRKFWWKRSDLRFTLGIKSGITQKPLAR